VSLCVCVRERERERESVCVCMCARVHAASAFAKFRTIPMIKKSKNVTYLILKLHTPDAVNASDSDRHVLVTAAVSCSNLIY